MWVMTRSPLLLIAAVGAALALGACGSSDDNGGSGASAKSQQDKAFDGALKFAKCMRDHGIDVPDPQRTGTGGIKQTINGRPGSKAKMDAAQKDCQKYMQIGGGRAPSAAEQAKAKDAMLAYAKCMRDNGVNMPDPKFSNSGGGMTFQLGGPDSKGGSTGGPNPDSPTFKAADKVCHSKLADLEKGGPGGDGGPSTSGSGEDGKG
jgi:hypothetical protein